MREKLVISVVFAVLIVLVLSGCQEQTGASTGFDGVRLVSSVVEFANASLNVFKDKNDNVYKVEVKYLFHNIAGKDLTVKVTASFYDVDENLIGSGGPKNIRLLEDYTEQSFGLANSIVYESDNVERIDHVVLYVVEDTS